MVSSQKLLFAIQLLYSFLRFIEATSIPIYGINITSDQEKINTYKASDGSMASCSTNCIACESDTQCRQCQSGYFLFPSDTQSAFPKGSCLPCPQISSGSSNLGCADCLKDNLNWNSIGICTYEYDQISQSVSSSTLSAYQTQFTVQTAYHITSTQVVVYPPQIKGFCNAISHQENPLTCFKNYLYSPLSSYEEFLQLSDGYYLLQKEVKKVTDISACPDNCLSCRVQEGSAVLICNACSDGYAIFYSSSKYSCTKCSTMITSCDQCNYGNKDNDLNQYPMNWLTLSSTSDIVLRCSSCSKQESFLIPSLDMLSCETCKSELNCNGCRYIQQDFAYQLDHTASPFVVTDATKFSQVCLLCSSSNYFVDFSGKCVSCGIAGCDVCFYGGSTELLQYYTLQNKFVYMTSVGSLSPMCYQCKDGFVLTSDNLSCVAQSSLSFTPSDTNCVRWKQVGTTMASDSDLQCQLCKLYGLDLATRKCSIQLDTLDMPKCLSFYAFQEDNIYQKVCTACDQGYVPSLSNGCVKCDTGLGSSSLSFSSTGVCSSCTKISSTGYSIQQYVMSFPTFSPSRNITQIETDLEIKSIPFCLSCGASGSTLISGRCQQSTLTQCGSQCYSGKCTLGTDGTPLCSTCAQIQETYIVNSSSSLLPQIATATLDQKSCIQCPRYCSICESRSKEELQELNPYFIFSSSNMQFTTKCLKCKDVSELCVGTFSSGGMTYSCPASSSTPQPVMFLDTNLQMCRVCDASKPQCSRIFKIQKVVDCRSSIDSTLIYDQVAYAKAIYSSIQMTELSGKQSVFALSLQQKNTKAEINLDELEMFTDFDNLMRVLNEEGFEQIQLEIFVIQQSSSSYVLQDGTKLDSYCLFSGNVVIKSKLAHWISSSKLSLSFQSLSSSGVGKETLNFVSSNTISMMGFNVISLSTMNFYYDYYLGGTEANISSGLQPLILSLEDNLMRARLFLNKVNFISGYSQTVQSSILEEQEKDVMLQKRPFFQILLNSVTEIIYTEGQISGFLFNKEFGPFAFSSSEVEAQKQVEVLFSQQKYFSTMDVIYGAAFEMKLNKITFQNNYFYNCTVIGLIHKKSFFSFSNSFLLSNSFKNSVLVTDVQDSHSSPSITIALNTIKITLNSFFESNIILSYLSTSVKVDSVTITDNTDLKNLKSSGLFASNSLVMTNSKFTNTAHQEIQISLFSNAPIPIATLNQNVLNYYNQRDMLQFSPISFSLNTVEVSNFYFNSVSFALINIASSNYVIPSSLSIVSCIFSNLGAKDFSTDIEASFLIGIRYIKNIYIDSISVTDGNISSYFFIKVADFVTFTDSSYKRTSTNSIAFPDGIFAHITDVAQRIALVNMDFENLNLFSSLIYIHQMKEVLVQSNSFEILEDTIYTSYIQQVKSYLGDYLSYGSFLLAHSTFNKISLQTKDFITYSSMSIVNIYSNNLLPIILDSTNFSNIIFTTTSTNLEQAGVMYIQGSQAISVFNKVKIQSILSLAFSPFYFTIKSGFILESSFSSSNYDDLTQTMSINGGFFNFYLEQLVMANSTFENGVANSGGAIFLKTKGLFVGSLTNITMKNIYTSLNSAGLCQGGAIYLNTASSTNNAFSITKSTFDTIGSCHYGGILYCPAANSASTITIASNTIIDVMAVVGSIVNIQFDSMDGQMLVQQNSITSRPGSMEKFLDKLGIPFLSTFSDLASFSLIYLYVGHLDISNNTIDKCSNFQKLVSFDYGSLTFNDNIIKSIDLFIFPYMSITRTTNISFNGNLFQDMQFNLANNNNSIINYLRNFGTNLDFIYISLTLFVYVDKLTMRNVKCSICNAGMSVNSPILSTEYTNCLFDNNQFKMVLDFYNTLDSQANNPIISLSNTQFINNKVAQGSYYTFNGNTTMTSCLFKDNTSSQYGGGIYVESPLQSSYITSLVLIDTTVTQNQAEIGGGLYMIIGYPALLSGSSITGNNANIMGSNIHTRPQTFELYIVQSGKTTKLTPNQLGQYIQTNWTSGSVNTDRYFLARLLDYEGRISNYSDSKTASMYLSSSTINKNTYTVSGGDSISFDQTQNGFLINQGVFNSPIESFLSFDIKSDSLQIPQFNPTDGNFLKFGPSKPFTILLQMRDCLKGEIYLESSLQCYKCEKGQYSLNLNSTQCSKCPVGAESCPGGKEINAEIGYWRENESTDLILSCTNKKSNCIGGLGTGNELCFSGLIGPLCETCDIYAKYWGERWAISDSYSCSPCSQVQSNMLKLVLFNVYSFVMIFISTNGTITTVQQNLRMKILIKLKFSSFRNLLGMVNFGIIMKILTNYFQLMSFIKSFDLQIPSQLTFFSEKVGNSVQQMAFSLDCNLVEMAGSIPLIYFRLIWSILTPIFFFLITLLIFLILLKVQKQQVKSQIFYTSSIFIFLFTQPSLIQMLAEVLNCRTLGKHSYIMADLELTCHSSQHIFWLLLFVFPFLLLFAIIIPGILFYAIYKKKHKLHQIINEYKYGLLYLEYTPKVYFWEFVKIFQKTLFLLVNNIYDQDNKTKGIFFIGILYIYTFFSAKYKPYIQNKFNQIDQNLNQVMMINFMLAIIIYFNSEPYIQVVSFICMGILNAFFCFNLLKLVLSSAFKKFESQFVSLLAKLSEKFKFVDKIAKALKINQKMIVSEKRINQLWNVLRNHFEVKFSKTMTPKNIKPSQIIIEHAKNKQPPPNMIQSDVYSDMSDFPSEPHCQPTVHQKQMHQNVWNIPIQNIVTPKEEQMDSENNRLHSLMNTIEKQN